MLVRETDNVTAELIEEFADWLNEHAAPDTAAFASHAEMFLDWREPAPLETLRLASQCRPAQPGSPPPLLSTVYPPPERSEPMASRQADQGSGSRGQTTLAGENLRAKSCDETPLSRKCAGQEQHFSGLQTQPTAPRVQGLTVVAADQRPLISSHRLETAL